ncbi:hypothetical protein SeLEV6574_g02303 [Synchytrium endobioticum]|nr:hypothetical protein SeLEV6574_g02303 [Synchytrium endobioticum]
MSLDAKRGYYPGDAPSKGANDKTQALAVGIISLGDIKRIAEKLSGMSVEEQARIAQRQDRQEKQLLSKQRVSTWRNTLAGQRRAKLQAGNQRREAEERERLRLDEEFRQDSEARRNVVVERARRMQENERDPVRQLHSRLLLYNVLKVRDTQLLLKKERAGREEAIYHGYKVIAAAENAAAEAKDRNAADTAKARRLSTAAEQRQQHQQKMDKQVAEAKAMMQEGIAIRRADEEYRAAQVKSAAETKAKYMVFTQELVAMRDDVKSRKDAAKAHDIQQRLGNEAWIARKEKQTTMKRDLEATWFNQGIRTRELIGERSLGITDDIESKLNQQIARAVQDKDEKARCEAARKQEISKEQGQETKRHYIDTVQRKKEDKVKAKEEGQATLRVFLQQRDEYLENERRKKADALERGRELQKNHLAQMEESRRARLCAQQERRNDHSARDAQEREAHELAAYMETVQKEAWAQDNGRLQDYLQKALSQLKP